jgi:hypothetical protein
LQRCGTGSANPPGHRKIRALEAQKMMMKRNDTAGLLRSEFTGKAVNRRVNLCWLAVHGVAVCAIITQCLNPVRASDALPVAAPGTQTATVEKPPYVPQGRQMQRYKAFARQAELPVITVTDKTTLEVGGALKTDLSRLARLSVQEKEALAGQFGVPAGVIGKVTERAVNHPPESAAQFAEDIRAAVIDYRFLRGEWQRYTPPTEGQKLKANALEALQAGDISKAWKLYDGLQRPAPPGNLRIAAQP